MRKNKVTIQELSKILGLKENILRIHLCCLDKYKAPRTKPVEFFYNYYFLLDLKKFYKEKSESVGKCYKKYEDVVTRLNKIIKL